MVGRLIADNMQQQLGQPFVIENRPGASANTGTEMVAKADPDGYTIGVSLGGPLAINTLLFAKMPYDPAKDLALITMLTTQPSALVVHTSLGVNAVAELVDLLRKNPGKYNYGSIGNGSLSHLAMEALALKSGTTMVHVPYPGSPQAMTALLRNDVQMGCLPAIAVTPHVASGQVKILAMSLGQRSALMPGVPTLKEEGGDVGAGIRREEAGHVGELLGLADAAERDFLGAGGHVVLELDASLLRRLHVLVRLDESDQHCIDQDVVRCAFMREHLGQRHAGG